MSCQQCEGMGILPHRMDAPDGPTCACGKPSRHQSGWCGREHLVICGQCADEEGNAALAEVARLTAERDALRELARTLYGYLDPEAPYESEAWLEARCKELGALK